MLLPCPSRHVANFAVIRGYPWPGRPENLLLPAAWASLRPVGQGPSPHRLHTLCIGITRCRPVLNALCARPEGEILLTDVSAQAAGCHSDRGQQPRKLHAGDPGTGSGLSTESVRSPQSARPARTIGLRPAGWRCWMCGQAGRADPPETPYFCCDGCDVRWYGGTGPLRHSPEFTQHEFTWWIAGKLARIRYIDHAAEHTASPA